MVIQRSYRFAVLLLVMGLCLVGAFAVAHHTAAAQDNNTPTGQGTGTATDDEADTAAAQDEAGDTDSGADTAEDDPTEDNPAETEGYTPTISAADFVQVVDNPYFPLIPGTRWVYAGKLANGGTERIELEILHETYMVNGVAATVLHDTVYQADQLVEETFDWFAQDKAGNVWYLGEAVDNYENGQLVDHHGSWEWGVDGALPGVNMWANPAARLDQIYYQEYYAGAAEDQGQLLSASEQLTVPAGVFTDVVQTYDFSALDPNLQEHKFFAPGVGNIKELDLLTGEEVVLVEFIPAPPLALLPQPTSGMPAGIAPTSARVDLVKPTLSNPLSITNPLLPITQVDQIIQVGEKEGKPHRTEFTLLPITKTIAWNGEQTTVRVLQFVAYLDGRILEHALDFLAQADDGAVWYFGEDVFNYENGVVVDQEGTWLAGQDGPPAMIMPAHPQAGDVYRVENFPSKAFEEVTVMAVDQTLEGPRGLIKGVMFVQQIGLEGKTTVKAFAPGYGEFLAHGEDAAVAVPTDALVAPLPVALKTLLTGANTIIDAVAASDWAAINTTLVAMSSAWAEHQATVDLGSIFPLLDTQMAYALNALTTAVAQSDADATNQAAFGVAIAALDLQLPYQGRAVIDQARFNLWTRRLLVDLQTGEAGAIQGDVTTLELISDRFAYLLDDTDQAQLETLLGALRTAVDKAEDETIAGAADQLFAFLTGLPE